MGKYGGWSGSVSVLHGGLGEILTSSLDLLPDLSTVKTGDALELPRHLETVFLRGALKRKEKATSLGVFPLAFLPYKRTIILILVKTYI